jgi:hypothetical protein
MFGYQKKNDQEEMLRKALMSSKMVDPSMMAGMTANQGAINNFAAPAAPSESMLGMQAQTGAIDNTAAAMESLSQAQTLDPAFLQAQQNAESEIAREQMMKGLAGASAAMAYQPTSAEMIPLQRGGGMMAIQEPPMMMGQTSASQGQDIMGLLNRFK